MRLIDADALDKVKFHPLPYTHITPSGANAESYKWGWNDAIDAIMENAPTIDLTDRLGEAYYCGYTDAEAKWRNPVVHGEWMPCSERLPSANARVLITVCHTNEAEDYSPEPFYEITLDFICQGKWYKHGFFDEYSGETVVAWMPLPEPYKEGEIERVN